ncbi:MAG TPA: hypothetical protein VMT47_12405 [Polyangia bacterium]|nr:hypothetical protein [Polyangia bacterium]
MGVTILALSGQVHAGAVLEQSSSATGTTSAAPMWSTKAVTAGHLLVAVVQWQTTTASNGVVTAPAGWALAAASSHNFGTSSANIVNANIYYYENGPARAMGAIETFYVSSSTGLVVQLAEVSGIVASGSLDVTGTQLAANATSIRVSSSSATSTGPEVVIGAFGTDATKNNQDLTGSSAPFSDLGGGSVSSATTTALGTYDGSVSAGTTIGQTISSTNKSSNMVAAIATFKVSTTTYYWRGVGGYANRPPSPPAAKCYGYFDDGGCWSTTSGGATGTTAPSAADNVVFDGNGTGDCTLSPLSGTATRVNQITVQSGYTGTMTQAAQGLSLSGAFTLSGGTFVTGGSSLTIATNASGTYDGDLVISGGTFTGNGAAVALRSLTVSGGAFNAGSGDVSTNNGGLATLSGGTVTFGSGALTLGAGLTVSGATVTLGTSAPLVTGTVTVASGTLNFTNGAANPDVSLAGLFTQSGGTVNLNGAQLTVGSAVAAGSDAFTMTGGTFNTSSATAVLNVTGDSSASGATTTLSGGATFNGASGTETFAGVLTVDGGATMSLGTASMTSARKGGGNANGDMLVAVGSGGTLTLGSAGFAFASTSAMTIDGTLNAGSGAVSFSGGVTISSTGTFNGGTSSTTFSSTLALVGAFNAQSASSVMFSGAVTMTGTSKFNGGAGSGTFAAAPTLTAGTFTVGSAGTTGRWTLAQGATFSAGMTLAFPANGGELATASAKTLSVAGTITSAVTGATLPRIDCPTCTTNQGFVMQLTGTSVLDVSGLQFDHVSTAGVQIADGATYTRLEKLKFTNNAAGGTSSGTHLVITKSNSVIVVDGCYFDATAQYNVTLNGVSGSTGVRAIFEYQSTTINGARAGDSYDLDADSNHDNVADNAASPRFGSVIEWASASPTDTTGVAVGFPAPAFDWNTFTFYGIYVAFKDTAGAGSADVLWLRNNDGSAKYSYSVPQTSGDIVGTPFFDTVNETKAGVDANGDGDQADTDVRVVYIGTSAGHVIKLIDTGSGFARPASGPWSSDFTSSSVATISSPLVEDGTNLYFGGTDGSAATKVFGVQVAGGANEGTLQKNIGSVSAVTTTPSWKVYAGATYVFLGSTAVSGQAYVYRINMMTGAVNASFSGPTSNVNDSIVLTNDRAYAVTDGGKMYVLDAANFAAGGFTNVAGAPYVTAAAKAIKDAPWVDYKTNDAYFGDDGGNVYAVTSAGASINAGFPFVLSSSVKLSSSPMYLHGGGVIAIGANDGFVYFIDRNNGSNAPAVFKRFFVTGAGTVSSVSYNSNTSQYLVSSSDGKLVFINGADVKDPTAGTQ